MSLLEVRDLTVKYGDLTAVNDVSFSVEDGGVLAVLGRNGAGKSSLLEAIAGVERPDSGEVLWQGRDITAQPADKVVRKGISLVAEGRRIFPGLTVRENLRLGGFHLDPSGLDAALDRVHGLFPILEERRAQPAGQLSGGQQQMLCIGRALIAEPALILLDEPSLGLAPKVAADVYHRLRELRDRGLAFVIVEQQVERVLNLADDVIVLRLGEITLSAPASEIDRDDPRLQDAYLGKGAA